MTSRALIATILLLLAGCGDGSSTGAAQRELPPGAEAWSLTGVALFAPPVPEDKRAAREKQLAEAQAMPADSADRAVWVGRRLGALNRFREAIAAFTDGIAKHPDDPRLYRHRGHRYITVRRFDLAIADLERAAKLAAGKPEEPEPDMQPTSRPVNTLQSSIWYHLALAYYLTHDDQNALRCHREGLKSADNPDRLCSTSYWMWLTLRRMGQHEDAAKLLLPIRADMQLVESQSYHKLLLVYRGDKTADEVLQAARADADPVPFPTIGYGLLRWFSLNGDDKSAAELAREILASKTWQAFGFIATEEELARSAASTPRTPEYR